MIAIGKAYVGLCPFVGIAPLSISGDDEEIALDLQVLAGLLPGARIVVYFTGNSAEALANAIGQAVHDELHGPQVLVDRLGKSGILLDGA